MQHTKADKQVRKVMSTFFIIFKAHIHCYNWKTDQLGKNYVVSSFCYQSYISASTSGIDKYRQCAGSLYAKLVGQQADIVKVQVTWLRSQY